VAGIASNTRCRHEPVRRAFAFTCRRLAEGERSDWEDVPISIGLCPPEGLLRSTKPIEVAGIAWSPGESTGRRMLAVWSPARPVDGPVAVDPGPVERHVLRRSSMALLE